MINFSLGNKKKPRLGIDVGGSSVKVVEVQPNKDGAELLSYAIVQLPEGATEDGVATDPIAVAEAITAALAQMKTKTKNCAMAVSGASVITKTIMVSSELTDAQLETEIELEADQHIPFPLDDVALDFYVVGPSDKAEDSNDVLIVACRKEAVDQILDICDSCELVSKVIDFEPYAQLRALSAQLKTAEIDSGSVVAMIDVGSVKFDVKIAHNNEIVYSREQMFGMRQLEEDLAVRFDISAEEAARQLLRPDLLPPGADGEFLGPFRAQVLQQITRSLQLFFAATNYNDVDAIMVSGGASSLPGLMDLLREDLGTTVLKSDPSTFIDTTNFKDKNGLKRDGASLMLACGLGLWGESNYGS